MHNQGLGEGAKVRLIIGCDFPRGFQQLAMFDNQTGEIGKQRVQNPEGARACYGGLAEPAGVGMEACGHRPWFERRLQELGPEQ